MNKPKTIADMTAQGLIKSFIPSFGELFEAQIRTSEITIKANTDASIKVSEERITSEFRADMASKQDIQRLEQNWIK